MSFRIWCSSLSVLLVTAGVMSAVPASAAPEDGRLETSIWEPPEKYRTGMGAGRMSLSPVNVFRTDKFTLTGQLFAGGLPRGGETMSLMRVVDGTETLVAQARTDDEGVFRLTAKAPARMNRFRAVYAGSGSLTPTESTAEIPALYKTRIVGVKVFKEKKKKKQPSVFMQGRIQRWENGVWRNVGSRQMKDRQCHLYPEFRPKGRSTWQSKNLLFCPAAADGRFKMAVARPLGSTKGHWRISVIRKKHFNTVIHQLHYGSTSKAVFLNR